MYYRFFKVTDGPLIEELSRLKAINDQNYEGYKAIAVELAASQWMMFGTKFAGFIFESEPDNNVWRQVPKYSKVYAPRKNVPAGKDLWQRINAVVRKVDYNDALKAIEAPQHRFCIDGNRMTRTALCAGLIGEGTIFVQVPWKDVDPTKLAEYAANQALPDGERKTWFDSELDHLLWTPHPSMVEVKEWEMLKWKEENHKPESEQSDDD